MLGSMPFLSWDAYSWLDQEPPAPLNAVIEAPGLAPKDDNNCLSVFSSDSINTTSPYLNTCH